MTDSAGKVAMATSLVQRKSLELLYMLALPMLISSLCQRINDSAISTELNKHCIITILRQGTGKVVKSVKLYRNMQDLPFNGVFCPSQLLHVVNHF